jgi:hypothetical protein
MTPQWKRPKCDAGACVEVLEQYGSVIVRNSKRPLELVVYDSEEWTLFLKAVKNGEFDL